MTTPLSKIVTRLLAALMFVLCLAPTAEARWYRADLGVWMKKDPLGYFDDANRYRYVRSAPMSLRDSSGLIAIACNSGTCKAPPSPDFRPKFPAQGWPADNGPMIIWPQLDPNPSIFDPPIMTPTACCESALRRGLDKGTPEGEYGGVICCHGVAVACSWYNPSKVLCQGGNRTGCSFADILIQQCIRDHEKDHIPTNQPCKGLGIYRPHLDPETVRKDECLRRSESVWCFYYAYAECEKKYPENSTERFSCIGRIQGFDGALREWLEKNCKPAEQTPGDPYKKPTNPAPNGP